MWPRNKDKPRFRPFHDRVLHVVVNDNTVFSKYLYGRPGLDNTELAKSAEKRGGEKVKQMLQSILSSNRPGGRDLVVNFGHTDEIPSPRNMVLMKRCQPKQLRVDSGTWMPMGRFYRAVQADTPFGGEHALPYAHGSPTFLDLSNVAGRGQDASVGYLLGGWHLTAYPYPPHALLKLLSCANCTGKSIPIHTVRVLQKGPTGVREFYESLSKPTPTVSTGQTAHLQRYATVENLKKRIPYRAHPELLQPPRVVQCNPERFEVWYGHSDRRLRMAPVDAV